jgi:transposase InsO family protein
MFYLSVNTSKQAIHQLLDRRLQTAEETSYLVCLIAEIRIDHPTLSCRAMYYKLHPHSIGRDAFELLCKEHHFYIERKIHTNRTTDSSGVIRFDNLLKGMVLTDYNQACSSDITYYELNQLFYYITFIQDCWSRRIIGHQVSKRLTTEQTTLPALQMALATRGGIIPSGMVFHSDGGGQYYDKSFLAYTSQHNIRNSMCEYPWENGKAERLNGVIKNNYLKYYTINSYEELVKCVDRAVTLYNVERPHKSLNYQIPVKYENKEVTLHKQTKLKIQVSSKA